MSLPSPLPALALTESVNDPTLQAQKIPIGPSVVCTKANPELWSEVIVDDPAGLKCETNVSRTKNNRRTGTSRVIPARAWAHGNELRILPELELRSCKKRMDEVGLAAEEQHFPVIASYLRLDPKAIVDAFREGRDPPLPIHARPKK